MKKLLFALIFLPMAGTAQTTALPSRQTINTAWEFRQAGKADWKPTKVPVSVHTALLQNGMIEDPFYRDNEEKLQWIEQSDWEFQSSFDVQESTLQHAHVELVFKGIDTYAHIYLNDSLILETDNMFRTWKADVKKWLKPRSNKLHIYFDSPVKKVEEDWKNLGYELPGGIRTMTRKAQFHYGWDWGPRFAGCGILKMPEIVAWDDFIIENIFVTTQSISEDRAKMVARIRYRSDVRGPATITAREGKHKSVEDRMIITGVRNDSVTFEIPNPKLWWCNGMGEHPLYDVTIEIRIGVKTVDKADVRTGIRKIELITEKDAAGETFYFKLNGKPVFIKGANYIPQDMFQDRVTPEQYKHLLNDVTSSNMNMLRVWGGGIYEDDLFYQLCDTRGILVWQDFMYACAMYPGGKFLKTAAKEAQEQVERLRQHPCMALFCGNNENNEAWNNWGWQMQFNEAQRKQLWRDYTILFNDLLPTYVNNFGGGIPYWESSPRYGRANNKSLTEGDSHYWGVWHSEEPFEMFDKKVPRFMSEYGFQSFPEWATIESFTTPEDRQLESKVMLSHQKHPRGNALIAEYMKRDFRPTKNFEDFVYVSQLLQAEGMRTGIEAHRRNKPYCMGTLYWQLNDVWPVASWSSIDYYGRWKALQYYAKNAYTPVIVLPTQEEDIIKLYGVSDLAEPVNVTLQVRALTLDGTVLSDVTKPDITLKSDSSHMIWQGYTKTVLDRRKPENCVVECTLKSADGQILSRRLFYLVPPKKLNLSNAKVNVKVEQVNDGYQLTVQSERLAKNVFLSTSNKGGFSDNYFDLLPGEQKKVLFKTDQILDNPQHAFKIRHLADTY
jgi:beta-mannosidase